MDKSHNFFRAKHSSQKACPSLRRRNRFSRARSPPHFQGGVGNRINDQSRKCRTRNKKRTCSSSPSSSCVRRGGADKKDFEGGGKEIIRILGYLFFSSLIFFAIGFWDSNSPLKEIYMLLDSLLPSTISTMLVLVLCLLC